MAWLRYREAHIHEEDENSFVISISDLMAGLLSVFILTLAYYILNFSQATAQLTDNDVKRAAILNSIKEELKKNGIEVKIDTDHGVLHLPEGILFDPGEAQIKEEGIRLIKILAPVLNDILRREEYKGSVETIFIEGHTDNIPINTPRFASNWELSTQRAINTWNTLAQTTPELCELKNRQEQYIFSCSGYADTRPIRPNSNETTEGRKENRRIDLRFTMTPPSREEAGIIKEVRRQLDR
ncbi:MAG: OmpA/MotB family protein [Bacillota bacterium]